MQDPLVPPLPAPALAQYQEGVRLHRERDLAGALARFNAALKLAGEHPGILEAMAAVAFDGGDSVAAERIVRHVLRPGAATQPVSAAILLARVVYRQQRYAEAVALLEPLLARLPFHADLHGIFASALECVGDFERSLAVREQVYAAAPDAEHASQLAASWLRQACYDTLRERLPALLQQYGSHAGLLATAAVHALGCGDYRNGLRYLRAQQLAIGAANVDARFMACPRWDGLPFDGTLLVSLEAMIGDEILMSSLLPALVALAQPTIVEIDARCLPLFRRAFPGLTFVDRKRQELGACIQPDGVFRRAESLDLLELLHRDWVLPGTPGWLPPAAGIVQRKRAEYRARWPGKKLVGISWRSKQFFNGMDSKSVPLEALAATLATADTVFIDLQYGDVSEELAALAAQAGVPLPWRDPEIDSFSQIDALAAQLSVLDRVVTVSNTTAHLAGALGIPTTVLLPKRFPVLWHWGFLGDQTTWYGSVRLLRNTEDSGWAQLDRQLAADLAGPGVLAGPDSRRPQEIR